MANSRIMLTCRHCGKGMSIGKGYFGAYAIPYMEGFAKQLNDFYKEHEHGTCQENPDDIDCSDNARDHFMILEEGEKLSDVAPREEVARDIFEELEQESFEYADEDGDWFCVYEKDYEELKKKHLAATGTDDSGKDMI